MQKHPGHVARHDGPITRRPRRRRDQRLGLDRSASSIDMGKGVCGELAVNVRPTLIASMSRPLQFRGIAAGNGATEQPFICLEHTRGAVFP